MAKKAIRPIRIEGNVAYIPLTKGYTAIIDAADVPLVAGRQWCAVVGRGTVYARWHYGERGRKVSMLLHRLLLSAPADRVVDHRDGNGLNNRRANLRLATVGENTRNQRITRRNKSGIKGVSWSDLHGKWRADIAINGRGIYLGLYSDKLEAAAAYVRASNELHGEFGRAR